MKDIEAVLEQELLRLGRNELALEQRMQLMRQLGKEAVAAGRLDEADSAWSLYEEARSALAKLQPEITKVEIRLYGLRRQKRH